MIPSDGSVWYQDSVRPGTGGSVHMGGVGVCFESSFCPCISFLSLCNELSESYGLKTTQIYYLSVSMGQEFRQELAGSSARGFITLKSRYHPEQSSLLRLLAISDAHGCWQNSASWVVELRPSLLGSMHLCRHLTI